VISRRSDFQIVPADSSQTAKVECNRAKSLRAAAFRLRTAVSSTWWIQSMPTLSPSDVPTGWYVRAYNVDSNNDNAGTVEVRAYAICASPGGLTLS
jgi:hypothetical protein